VKREQEKKLGRTLCQEEGESRKKNDNEIEGWQENEKIIKKTDFILESLNFSVIKLLLYENQLLLSKFVLKMIKVPPGKSDASGVILSFWSTAQESGGLLETRRLGIVPLKTKRECLSEILF